MDEAEFSRYIDAFNEHRYDEMVSFYTDDVELELPAASPQGPDGIRDYYVALHKRLREWLRVDFLMLGTDKIAVELYTEFEAYEDLPSFSLKPLVKDELLRCTNFVHYDLRDEHFARIRVARYKIHS
jgi:hypothetical protein